MTFDEAGALALALPGVAAASCYGAPGFRIRGKILCRLYENGRALVLKVGFDERELLLQAEPDTFYITDHYRPYSWMLVELARVDRGTLRRLLFQAWTTLAPKAAVRNITA